MRWTEPAGTQLMHCRENSIDSVDGGRIHPVLVAKDAVGVEVALYKWHKPT